MSDHLTETAPEKVWLQVNPDARTDPETGEVEDSDMAFPEGNVTWCASSIGGLEVEYVRADLVRAALPINVDDRDDADLYRLASLLGMTETKKDAD